MINHFPNDAIASAEAERDVLLAECRALLVLVSRRPGFLKLLGLAKVHLKMLAEYKTSRGRSQRDRALFEGDTRAEKKSYGSD